MSQEETLEAFARHGILPLVVSETGSLDEPISEVIICESISGGADYRGNMPARLTLTRRLSDGTEYRAEYQSK